jgi:uncharacterized membrane protein YagU involved in acid resistance
VVDLLPSRWAARCGAMAGLLATIPMTLVMELMRRRLPSHERGRLPPRTIAMRAARRLGMRRRMDERQSRAVTLVTHFGFGAATGALYAPWARRLDPLPPLLEGTLFGLGVWLVSYMGWLPAVGLFGPATRDAHRRAALMIAAHVVWGAALGFLFDRFSFGPGTARVRSSAPDLVAT